jgi:hypothetical protein
VLRGSARTAARRRRGIARVSRPPSREDFAGLEDGGGGYSAREEMWQNGGRVSGEKTLLKTAEGQVAELCFIVCM